MVQIFRQYVSAKSLLLMLTEATLILLSLLCAIRLRFWGNPVELSLYISFPDFAVQSLIVVAVCISCFYWNQLYDLSIGYSAVERVLRIEQSLGAASLLLGFVYFCFPSLLLSRGVFIIAMLLSTGFVILSRRILDQVWQMAAPSQRVAILGTGELALALASEIERRGDLGIQMKGFIGNAAVGPGAIAVAETSVIGSTDDIEALAAQHSISRLIVALDDRRGILPTRALVRLKVQGVRVEDAPEALSALTGRISLRAVRPSSFVFSDGFHRSTFTEVVKRILDLASGLLGLAISLPVMFLIGIVVKLESKGPVLYKQTRVGRMGKCFEVLKFRSMSADAEKGTGARWAAHNDPRVTRVGGFLRKYRLDELPQFINVIRGEMSFVGPRPERPQFVDELRKCIPYYDERHSVRPGLTGWAQVQYRYGSSVEDASNKLEYDLFYLKNMSLTFDLAIIFQTVRIVLGGHGGR